MTAIEVRGIDHVVIRAADLERMIAFYRDVLGCAVERRVDDLGLVQLRAGSALVDLVAVDSMLGQHWGAAPGAEGRNMDHLCLRLERFDVEALRRHLQSHDVEVGELATRYGAEGKGPSLYIKDPEDNVVELKGPPDP